MASPKLPQHTQQPVLGHDVTLIGTGAKASEHAWQLAGDSLHLRDAIGRVHAGQGKHRWWTLTCSAKGCRAAMHVSEAELLKRIPRIIKPKAAAK